MGQYAGFVYGSGITSLGILLCAIACYIYLRAQLGYVRDLMPFRCRFASGLFYLCSIKATVMIYFLISVTYQVTHGRPVCRGTDDWSYALGWVDWALIFILMTWGGALLLVLLWNMYGDMREAGRFRRHAGQGPSLIERVFSETKSAREESQEARHRAEVSARLGQRILQLLEREPTIWDSLDKLTTAMQETHEQKMDEMKEELTGSVDEVKEQLVESVDEAKGDLTEKVDDKVEEVKDEIREEGDAPGAGEEH